MATKEDKENKDKPNELNEKQRVVCYMLQEAPPHQLLEVLSEVKKATNAELLSGKPLEEQITNVCESRVIRLPLTSPHTKNGVVSKQGRIGPNLYLEPLSKQQFTFNPLNHDAATDLTATDAKHFPEEAEKFRVKVEEALGTYIKQRYNAHCVGWAVYGAVKDKVEVDVVIAASHSSMRNFWAGSWTSCYKAVIDSKHPTAASVDGSISVWGHYFEEGNVQVKTNQHVNNTVSIKEADNAKLGQEIVKVIIEAENKFHEGLETVYLSEVESRGVKCLRRQLPICKQMFDWGSLRYHLGQAISKMSQHT